MTFPGLCVLAAILLGVGQWPESLPSSPASMVEYVPALLLAGLGVLGAILCAGFACVIGVIARLGRGG